MTYPFQKEKSNQHSAV